jgi:hypothetical protein
MEKYYNSRGEAFKIGQLVKVLFPAFAAMGICKIIDFDDSKLETRAIVERHSGVNGSININYLKIIPDDEAILEILTI